MISSSSFRCLRNAELTAGDASVPESRVCAAGSEKSEGGAFDPYSSMGCPLWIGGEGSETSGMARQQEVRWCTGRSSRAVRK
eukprot:scaffold276810_cov35-Tisochrysis_lutea.AAC.1